MLQHDVCACVYARARAGADLDYRAPSADFPPSSPRFHGRPSPRRENYPDTPSIPLFRSRRFNPGFSTQFGALHGGLYAPARLTRHIRYTHPLSPSLSLFLYLLPARITYLPSGAHAHACARTYTRHPPISRIASSLVSTLFVLVLSRERPLHATYPLFPSLLRFSRPLPLSFTVLTSCLRALLLARTLSLSLCFSLHPSSSSLSLRLFLYPLRHRLYPREQPPPP